MEQLSARLARRIALAASGFSDPSPAGRVDRRHLRRVLGRVGLLQIDSVNVVARAHLLPAFSRLGPYPVELLHRMAYRDSELFEYWGHEASLLPVALHPLLRWRMAHGAVSWGSVSRVADRPELVDRVLTEVRARGPVRAAELEERRERRGTWWDRGEAKLALEYLFWVGEVAVADRTSSFERRYDLPERVLPSAVLDAPTPSRDEAQRALLALAGASLGVGTARDLADYHRIGIVEARARLPEVVEAGALVPAEVEGWREPAYVAPSAARPRRIRAAALLAPFDPVVWERSRAERLFGFRYRIEIYVPAPQRVYGYYVLPFLLDDALVARVDLKADRAARLLRVLGAYGEDGIDAFEVCDALAGQLRSMASWLGLDDVVVAERGDLAQPLGTAVARTETVLGVR